MLWASISIKLWRHSEGLTFRNHQKPPETNDVRIIRPILENLVAELKPGDPIRFRQVGRKYVIDTTEFRNLTGFHYLQALLKDPGEYISATSLSPISKQVDFEPVAEHSVVHKSINRRYALEKKLKWIQRTSGLDNQSMCKSDEAFEVAEELLKIKKYLSGATHAGKIKHIHNDYDRNRQTVSKCIRLAISYLEKHPDTAHIGQHLRTNVKPGARCRYSGKWNWSFG